MRTRNDDDDYGNNNNAIIIGNDDDDDVKLAMHRMQIINLFQAINKVHKLPNKM